MTTAHRERTSSIYAQQNGDGEAGLVFDNSGHGLLRAPGSGHAVATERPPTKQFTHGFSNRAQHRLTAREIAMLRLMDMITNRPGWHRDIYDADVVA